VSENRLVRNHNLEVSDGHLTFGGGTADANLGSISHDRVIYAERGAAIAFYYVTSLLHRLSASLVGSSDISDTLGVHPSGEAKGMVDIVTTQWGGVYNGQHNDKKRQKSDK